MKYKTKQTEQNIGIVRIDLDEKRSMHIFLNPKLQLSQYSVIQWWTPSKMEF